MTTAMLRFSLVSLLLLFSLPFARCDAADVVTDVAAPVAKPVQEQLVKDVPTEATEKIAGKRVALSNGMSELVIDVQWAEITDFKLLDHHPLALDEVLGGDSSLDPEGPLSVLGPFFDRSYAGHNALILTDDKPWMLHEQTERSATLQRHIGDLVYSLTYTLDENIARVYTRLHIVNTGTANEKIKPQITVINGVHQDSARQDAYYNGLFVYQDDKLTALDIPPLPTRGNVNERITRENVTGADYVAVRSRFFAALWSFDGMHRQEQQKSVVQVEAEKAETATETAPKRRRARPELDESEGDVQGAQGERSDARVMMLSKAFPGGPKIARQHQIIVNVVISDSAGKSFSIAPGESYTFDWNTLVSSMRKSDLALLTEAEQDLEYSNGFYRFFSLFSNVLLWLMNIIHGAFVFMGLESVAYAMAVMGVTVIVKGLMHRMTYKQQYSMMKMQQLAPELRRLQAQYKGDRQAMAMKQMELWKKNGVNPLGGCLPMLIQMPIFIALFQAFSHAGDLRGHGFFWVVDLTLQDQTIPLGFNWPFLGSPASLDLLPMLYLPVALFQSLSMKMTAPSTGDKQKDDMQASMQKMFRFMPLFFFVFIYFFPAGLVLYITISSLWSLVEIRMIRKSLGLDDPKDGKKEIAEA